MPLERLLIINWPNIIFIICSGSHTIGQARCTVFRTRIYNETNIDSSFATSLKSNCPSTSGDNNLAHLDLTSPTSFDNSYFKNLMSNKGLLHSDQQLFNGGSTDSQVNAYSSNSTSFLTDFANAMVKMGNLSPLIGTSDQIRKNCRKTKSMECAFLRIHFIVVTIASKQNFS